MRPTRMRVKIMAELKPYLIKTNKITAAYLKNHPNSVFNETDLPLKSTRLWISFDIKDDLAADGTRKNLEDWLNAQNAESWGTSVATFWVTGTAQEISTITDWLVPQLQKAKVLNQKNWQDTQGISLYIHYYSKSNIYSYNFDYFVLIQNKEIPNANGF